MLCDADFVLLQAAVPEAFFAVTSGSRRNRCHIYRVQLDQLEDWVSTHEKWNAPDAKQSDADMALPASYVVTNTASSVVASFRS